MKLLCLIVVWFSGLASSAAICVETYSATTRIESWEEIPIPPDTKLYRVAGPSMIASNQSAIEEVENWYAQQLSEVGWRVIVESRSDSGFFGGPIVSLRLELGNKIASVILTHVAAENYTMLQLTWVKR